MQTTRPRGRPRLAALDQRILEATLHVLAEGGYAHMSFDDIATAAHTTRATIYLRYPSKAELTAAAIVSAQRPLALPAARGDLRQDLIAQLRHFQESMAAPYSLPVVGMALAESSSTPELLSALREHVVATQRRTLLSILQQAIARNELAPETDIDLAIAQLVGSYYALSIAGESIPADWPERVVDQVLAGIRVQSV
jgi:AcrR family transcriptional regulator